MFKNNIIDLRSRLKVNSKQAKSHPSDVVGLEGGAAPVLDMTERRQEILKDERRDVRRTILTGFIGAFIVIPTRADGTGGLMKVDIYDISENGVAFDMELDQGQFKRGEEVAMRVYLSQDTYFPFVVKIQNQRKLPVEAVHRHGANFIKGTVNDEALFHFIKFIETVSASLERDRGDVMVSGLKK
jgi:hypothetical protein